VILRKYILCVYERGGGVGWYAGRQ
jgi:hypothetical protein